ncbi:DUF2147 domain-containing protein [Methylobacterium nodulans]|uniref:DUF2147 domain-containing protein n=1 Tax=Methylobacterium nodulans (strain LMG 21967 / CNCM I-2342 / ORS 2060) TaxID=460265 RepID=B8IHM4_METNO|nr:DUF2147 domain-containing protein [Methylobacterium nodulans]ACL61687.1 conserved hypothetical protein [Methylobacterium nodulans ORS 2060]
MTSVTPRLAAAALVGVMALAAMRPGPAAAADPTGTWLTEDGRARVRTEHCGPRHTHLCGYIVWAKKPLDDQGRPRLDQFNPDPGKQARPLLGHQMLLGLAPNEEGRFEGKIYNGDNGKSYDVTVWSERPTELSVKGCMLAVFCGSQAWKRVTDVAPGQLQGATDAAGGPRADPEWAAKPAATGAVPAPARRPRPDGPPAPTR